MIQMSSCLSLLPSKRSRELGHTLEELVRTMMIVLGLEHVCFGPVDLCVSSVILVMGDVFPELKRHETNIIEIIEKEEASLHTEDQRVNGVGDDHARVSGLMMTVECLSEITIFKRWLALCLNRSESRAIDKLREDVPHITSTQPMDSASKLLGAVLQSLIKVSSLYLNRKLSVEFCSRTPFEFLVFSTRRCEGCRKLVSLESVIDSLPLIFTITLDWERNNDVISSSVSNILERVIDIRRIYRYVGDNPYTNYAIVSMFPFTIIQM